MRNIIVAFTDHPTAQKIRTILTYNGFTVAGVCVSGAQVIGLAKRLDGGGTIICSARFHDMTTVFLSQQLYPEFDFLVLAHPGEFETDTENGIFSLTLPLKKADFLDSVKLLFTTGHISTSARELLKEEKTKKQEKVPLRTPEEIKLIEQAKSVLMERNNLTEEQAHRFLQKYSMNKGYKLTDTAREIIEGWF
ncbi:MAG: ANTAR domain-containing response regulator [Saccharofermentanales bacterium]